MHRKGNGRRTPPFYIYRTFLFELNRKITPPLKIKVRFCKSECIEFILDIQECAMATDNCHADANCTNTKGSFYCTCQIGYSGDGVNCVGEHSVAIKNI